MNEELHLSPFWKYEENSFFRLFPFEVKKIIPFCELNDGSGNPLDSALLALVSSIENATPQFDSWSLLRTCLSTEIHRPKLLKLLMLLKESGKR